MALTNLICNRRCWRDHGRELRPLRLEAVHNRRGFLTGDHERHCRCRIPHFWRCLNHRRFPPWPQAACRHLRPHRPRQRRQMQQPGPPREWPLQVGCRSCLGPVNSCCFWTHQDEDEKMGLASAVDVSHLQSPSGCGEGFQSARGLGVLYFFTLMETVSRLGSRKPSNSL